MISKPDALDIAKKLYGSRDSVKYLVSDYENKQFYIYSIRNPEELWWVTVDDQKDWGTLKSSTLVLIHKETGDVVYHGSGNDEG